MSRDNYAGGPPDKTLFVWHTKELITSAAWRGRSTNLKRLLDYIEEQLLLGGRDTNGRLFAEYKDLIERGISNGAIPATIEDGIRRKLIKVKQADAWSWPLRPDGKRQPNEFTLTYQATVDERGRWQRPTDEWRHFIEPERPKRRTFKRTRESIWEASKMVDGSQPNMVDGEDQEMRETTENHRPNMVVKPTTIDGRISQTLGEGQALPAVQSHANGAAAVDPSRRCGWYVSGAIGFRLCGNPVLIAGDYCPDHAARHLDLARP